MNKQTNSIDLSELKIGDKITHYCYGHLVEGTVIQTDGIGVCTRHEPVRWGNDVCIETWIQPSTYLQKKWGGKDLTPGPETTPGAFYEGNRIRCKITR